MNEQLFYFADRWWSWNDILELVGQIILGILLVWFLTWLGPKLAGPTCEDLYYGGTLTEQGYNECKEAREAARDSDNTDVR